MIFTAAAAWVAGAIGVTSALGVAAINVGVRVLAGAVISKLVTKRQDSPSMGSLGTSSTAQITGSRIQLRPSTDNKVGVVYGEAFVSGALVDAKISIDQKQMWYVYAIAEVTDTGVISIGNLTSTTETYVYWGDKTCIFDTTDRSKVVKFVNSDGEEDTSVDGYLNMYFFRNGSYTGINTGSLSAIDILSDSAIAADQRWNSSRYTYSGHAPTMANTMFAIVKLTYNQDASIVGEEQLQMRLQNSLTKPGDVIYDYLSNERYGGGIPYTQLDRASFDLLNNYSDELITYTPVGGGTATQPRYRINGPVNTNENVMTNLEYLVDSCDSWLQWNESIAKWSIVINQSYLDYTTYDDLFVVDASNITSGIGITPIDLNSSYNIVETQFPNSKIKDQTDYQFVYLDEADQNPNEPINKLILRFPQVNNSVQAKYLATRRLIQAREDLYITFDMDYSGIQIDAGDVVRINFPAYGWGPIPSNPTNPDKLFRVDQVQELKDSEGNLGVRVSMFEYNNQVYENIDISDYEPAANTGITDPTIVGKPLAPTIVNVNQESGTFDVAMIIPSPGAIIAVEFWYGPTPTIEGNNYKLWDTQFNSGTPVYTIGTTETTSVVGFQPGDYYWAVRCLTQTTKSQFSNATSQSWDPAQPAERKTCSQITTQTITYSDLYKLWAPSTRGTALVCDYTPAQDGSDVGGKATNQIQLDFSQTVYAATASTGLVSEMWTAVNGWGSGISGLAYGSNGYVFTTGTNIFGTGNIQGETSPNPDTYVDYKVDTGETMNDCAGNSSGVYVCVGDNATVYRSPNGYDSFTQQTLPSGAAGVKFNKVIWTGTYFVAVGGTGTRGYVMISADGITWYEKANVTSTGIVWSVAQNGSTIIALGSNLWKFYSTDSGATWSYIQIAGGSGYAMYDMTYASHHNAWIAVGEYGNTPAILRSTDDGANWTETYSTSATQELYSIATNFDIYSDTFAVGSNGIFLYSDDGGVTWSQQPLPVVTTWFVMRNYNNSFIAMNNGITGYSNLIWPISTSSVTWDSISIWQTKRLWAYGSSQNNPYDVTIQPAPDQLPNNIPVSATIVTGSYFAATPVRYFLVAGDLNNPSTPSTIYSSRKSIAITEFKG